MSIFEQLADVRTFENLYIYMLKLADIKIFEKFVEIRMFWKTCRYQNI